jgi:cytochrome b561
VNATTSPQPNYDRRTIWLHWLTAFTILFMWGGAHAIDWFPKGPLRVDARSVHIVVGALLALLVGYRLFWRIARGTKFADHAGWAGLLARLMHRTLYLLVLGTLALGMFNAWVRGDKLFNLGRIPTYGAYDPAARHALSESVVGWHEWGANLILILASGHAVMALYHQFVLKDGLLRRMMPGRA